MAFHQLTSLSNVSPVRITPPGLHSGMDITLQNTAATGDIYIGVNDNMSSENYGYRIAPGHAISFELAGSDALYAMSEIDEAPMATLWIDLESQG